MEKQTTRALFLDTAGVILELLGRQETADLWDRPSVLEGMTTGALAGHLARAIFQVEMYLDAPEPHSAPIDAAGYYLRLEDPNDLDSELNVAVRVRAEHAAENGPAATATSAGACLDRLRSRLLVEPAGRRVEAFGSVLLLDDYLETRLVEMAVHHDDLRRSIAVAIPDLEDRMLDVAIRVMVEVAIRRHGRAAVLTALTRRERDAVQALRVL